MLRVQHFMAKLTCLSLSLSLSPCPCPSPVPRLRDWNAEGSFISCLQDLTAGSWQEGVTRRLLSTHAVAAGAQGQEQEQVLVPAMELMRVSSAEDSDWQPQHPTGSWQEEAERHFFGQVRVRAGGPGPAGGGGPMDSPFLSLPHGQSGRPGASRGTSLLACLLHPTPGVPLSPE